MTAGVQRQTGGILSVMGFVNNYGSFFGETRLGVAAGHALKHVFMLQA